MGQNAIDLNVWKEIAISKQLLIKTATDVLSLDPECSDEEFKIALEAGLNKIATTETRVQQIAAQTAKTIAEIEQRLAETEQLCQATQESLNQITLEKEKYATLVETNRKLHGEKTSKLNTQIDEKDKALKSINVALGDTPQNIAKKIRTLNKKKHEDATAKGRIEDELKNLKKANREQKKQTTETKALAKKVVIGYRELQAYTNSQYDQLKELVDNDNDLTSPPKLDDELLESLHKTA